ncbi:major abundant protein BTP1 [Sarcoptes scabiei]|nr:major abundant protein BTP1 [Sarcoptes scabiei]
MQRIRDTFRKRVGQPVSSSDSSPIGSLEQQAKAEVDRLHRHRRQILMQKQLKQQQLQSSKFGFGSSGALVTLVNNDRSGDSSPTNFLGNSLSPKSSPSNSVFDGKFWLTDNEFNEEDYDFKIRSKNDFFDFDTIEIEINRSSRDEKRELGTNLDDSTTGSTGNKKSSFFVNEFSPEPPELFSSNRNDPTNELKSVDYQKSLCIEENQRDVPNPKYYQNVRSKSVDPSKPINILSSSAPSNNVAPTLDKTIQFPPLSPTLSSSDLLEIDSDYVGKTALQNRSDSATSTGSSVTFLDVPKWKLLIRRSSASPSNNVNATVESSIINRDCVHCLFLEELDRDFNEQHQLSSVDEENRLKSPSPESSECSHNDDDGTIKECSTQSSETCHKDLDQSDSYGSGLEAVDEFDADEFIEPIEGLPIVTLCPPEAESTHGHFDENVDDDEGSGITVISLEVPVIGNSSKQSRSASVDSPYLLQVPKRSDIEVREGPPKARSKSVDIVLPLNPGGPYLLIPPRHPPTLTKYVVWYFFLFSNPFLSLNRFRMLS